jgi:hypothetical protein
MPERNSSLVSLMSTRKKKIGENVYARVIVEKGQRAELAIIINDETSAEQLREAWTEIARCREQLRQLHGDGPNDLVTLLRFRHAQMYLGGARYVDVAMDTNYDCLVNLCRAALLYDEGDVAGTRAFMAIAQAQLRALRMKEAAVAEWTWRGLAAIREGRAPWTVTAGPADDGRVRDSIRQFKRDLETERLIIKAPPNTKPGLFDAAEIDSRAQELANKLLAQEPESGGMSPFMESVKRRHFKRRENPG